MALFPLFFLKKAAERLFIVACGNPDPANSRAAEMTRILSEDNGARKHSVVGVLIRPEDLAN